MNNTKWKELHNAMNAELGFPPSYVLKSITETEGEFQKFTEDVTRIGDRGDKAFCWGQYYLIERIKIRPRYLQFQGKLIPEKMVDETEHLESVLQKYSIAYEEAEDLFIIYGYKKI